MMSKITKVAIGCVAAALAVGSFAGCGTSSKSSSPSSSGNANTSSSASSTASAKNSNAAANANSGASGNASSNANASGASNGNWGRGDAAPVDGQKLGSAKVGYVTVPSDWKDVTAEKVDPRMVDSSGLVYLADPTTEFTSGVEGSWAFANSIRLETFPTSYESRADELLYKYRGENGNYGDPSIKKDKFCGHDASVIECDTGDGVHLTNIIFDKDGGGKACEVLTIYATPSSQDAVKGYAATWSAS